MTYLGMYILTKLDSWQNVSWRIGIVFLIASVLITAGCGIAASDARYGERFEHWKKYIRILRVNVLFNASIALMVFAQLIPTTKQAAFIWVAPQIIENGAVKDTVKNIPELTKLGTEYLKELLKEKTNDIKG